MKTGVHFHNCQPLRSIYSSWSILIPKQIWLFCATGSGIFCIQIISVAAMIFSPKISLKVAKFKSMILFFSFKAGTLFLYHISMTKYFMWFQPNISLEYNIISHICFDLLHGAHNKMYLYSYIANFYTSLLKIKNSFKVCRSCLIIHIYNKQKQKGIHVIVLLKIIMTTDCKISCSIQLPCIIEERLELKSLNLSLLQRRKWTSLLM